MRAPVRAILLVAALCTGVLVAAPGRDQSAGASGRLAGVVLWSRLDSRASVTRPAIGPAGTITGGRFADGHFGQAYRATASEDTQVSFPNRVVIEQQGTIEFWGRIAGFPPDIQGGGGFQPGFVLLADQAIGGFQVRYGVFFTANDGVSGGGLSGMAGLNSTASGFFAQEWTYADVLGKDVTGWHHYALTWRAAGLPTVAGGSVVVALFVDGQLESTWWDSPVGVLFPRTSAPLQFGLIDRIEQGAVEIDNLIVWDCAITDFSRLGGPRPVPRRCTA